jgi:zinc protease
MILESMRTGRKRTMGIAPERRDRRAAIGALFVLVLTGNVAKSADRAPDPTLPHVQYRLANGLEVILHQDKSIPLVAVDLWYHVGARNETPGHSGFAHLFEHMLFQGAEHIGEDVHFDILRKIGGTSVNGSTNFDRTNYYEVVPSHQLETALWLESDRMGYFLPKLTDKSFRNQVDVVRNERRQNYDNQPYRGALFPLFEALYPPGHPKRHLVIGLHEHLTSASVDDVRNFYKTWYVPANATLVLAGDFDLDRARALVEKWFGSFPKSNRPTGPEPKPAVLSKSVKLEHPDNFAKLRQLQLVWHAPAAFEEGEVELEIAAHTLGAQGTGRLYKKLVITEKLAQNVSASVWSMQDGSLFLVTITLKPNADATLVRQMVQNELELIVKEPISEREIARARVEHESSFIWGLESLLARAEALSRYNHYLGKPDAISDDLERYRRSNPIRIREVASRVLGQPNVELWIMPAGNTKAEP